MDILNLSKFNILSISENEFDFLIQVVTNSPPLACPHCGCIANLYKHDIREQICMDLPIHGKRVGLLIKRQRYRCRDCNRTFWEHLDAFQSAKRIRRQR
nr:transposase family protein [Paenibacillus sp. H1-7]